jgi:hypothetical protein
MSTDDSPKTLTYREKQDMEIKQQLHPKEVIILQHYLKEKEAEFDLTHEHNPRSFWEIYSQKRDVSRKNRIKLLIFLLLSIFFVTIDFLIRNGKHYWEYYVVALVLIIIISLFGNNLYLQIIYCRDFAKKKVESPNPENLDQGKDMNKKEKQRSFYTNMADVILNAYFQKK